MKYPPQAFQFEFALDTFAEDSESVEKKQKRRFKGNAHTGRPMRHPWVGNVAVDLKSMRFTRKDLPVLRDHDPSMIVGFTEKVEKTGDGVLVEGSLVDVTESGREVIQLLDSKVPMQMSVYVPPERVLRLAEGEEKEVNGHTVKGPGAVLYGSVLREVTITALGADDRTAAALLSAGDGVEVTEERLADRGHDTEEEMAEKHSGGGDQQPVDPAKIREQAIADERKRVAFIHEKSRGRGIPDELVQKAIDEGWDREKVATHFLDFIAERKEARLQTIRDATPGPSGNAGNADSGADELEGDDTFVEKGGKPSPKPSAFKAPEGTPKEFLTFEDEWRRLSNEEREKFGQSFERFAAGRAADEGLIFYPQI